MLDSRAQSIELGPDGCTAKRQGFEYWYNSHGCVCRGCSIPLLCSVVLDPVDVFMLQRARKFHCLEGTRRACCDGYFYVAKQWHHQRGSCISTLLCEMQLVSLPEL